MMEECKDFSRAWMAAFLADAESGDLGGALARASISPVEYHRARLADAVFASACRGVDQAVRLAIITNLEIQASQGNVRAAVLVLKGLDALRETMVGPFDHLPANVAAAMIAAGLEASGKETAPGWLNCPQCGGLGRGNVSRSVTSEPEPDWVKAPHLDHYQCAQCGSLHVKPIADNPGHPYGCARCGSLDCRPVPKNPG